MPDFGLAEALRPTPFTRGVFARGAARAATGHDGFFSFTDTALALPRGIEGAAQGVYGLADTVLFDALPDWDQRFLGRSRTTLGGLLEGGVQFAAGFWAGGHVLRAAGLASKLGPVALAAAKGALADVSVFDGHDARLSNFIQEFPSVRNPVTAFLAADPSDSQALGRFKNALEGVGFGALIEPFALAVKGLKAANAARAAGKGDKAVFRAAAEASEGLAEALDEANRRPVDPTDPRMRGEPLPKLPETPREPEAILKSLFSDEESIRQIHAATEQRKALGIDPAVNPRDFSAEELIEQGMTRSSLNLERYQAHPQGPLLLQREIETLVERYGSRDVRLEGETEAMWQQRLLSQGLDMAHAHETRDAYLASFGETIGEAKGLLGKMQARNAEFQIVAAEASKSIRAWLESPPDVAPVRLMRATEDLRFLYSVEAHVKGLNSEGGRILRAFQMDLPVRDLEKLLREEESPIFKRVVDADGANLLETMGGETAVREQFKKFLDLYGEGGVAGTSRLVATKEAFDAELGWQMANSLALSAWLSSPRSWAITSISGVFTSVMRTQERVLGGIARADAEAIKSGMRQALGLFTNAKDALSIAAKDFRTGRQTLLPNHTRLDLQRAKRFNEAKAILDAELAGTRQPTVFHPSVLGKDPDSFGGKMLRAIDYVVGLPQRAIMGSESFVKQINVRAVTDDGLYRLGTSKGLKGEELVSFIESNKERSVANGQAYTLDRIKREGMESARAQGLRGRAAALHMRDYVLSHKKEIEELLPIADEAIGRGLEVSAAAPAERGTFTHWLKQGTNKHPLLKLVLPFITTPSNLLTYARRRIDIVGPARFLIGQRFPKMMPTIESTKNAFLLDMLSADPMRKADAIGRVTMGTGLVTVFGGLAVAGRITGSGPAEKTRRDAARGAGWMPYSMQVGNKLISYSRLDPYASVMGVAADIVDYFRWADTSQQSAGESAAAALTTALLKPLTERSYLRGLANVVELLTDPTRRAESFFENFLSSVTPPGVAGLTGSFVTTAGDTSMREVRSLTDALFARVPGLSGTLEPRRNMFGEPIERTRSLGAHEIGSIMDVWMPIAYGEVSDDTVNLELARLNHGFTIPQTERGGVALIDFRSKSGQTAFDRYQELHGTLKIRGQTLRDTLKKVVQSRSYQRLPLEDTETGLESPRVGVIENIVQLYRDRAFSEVLREYPEVRAKYREMAQLRRRRSIGQPTPTVELTLPGMMRARLPALVSSASSRATEQF